MTELLLIRHGETESNWQRVVQTPDTPLNERGRLQARRLAERLLREGVDLRRVVSSDFARAFETATFVAEAFGLEVETEIELQERSFGDLRGRRYVEIGLDIMAEGYEPPAGESWEVFFARVERFWSRFTAALEESTDDGVIAIVTHGLVCHGLATRHLDLGDRVAPERWGNASLTVVERLAPWRVSLLNCTAHLEGEAADRLAAISGI